jgi:predicted nucleic acid-binding protein
MDVEEPIDVEALQRRFPWVGIASIDEPDLATRYREIISPVQEDRLRAADLAKRLVSGPLGYVDGIVLAMAERLKITDIATVDYKFLGMANPVSRLRPLRWVLQES